MSSSEGVSLVLLSREQSTTICCVDRFNADDINRTPTGISFPLKLCK